MKTLNLLANANWQFAPDSIGSWSVSGGSASIDTAIKILSDYHSIEVIPSNSSSTITLTLSNVAMPTSLNGLSAQFHCRVKCGYSVLVSVDLQHNQTMPAGFDSTRETRNQATKWAICRANPLPIPDIGVPINVNLVITITEHLGEPIYFTLPFLYGTYVVGDSKFAMSAYTQLPSFILKSERESSEAGNQPDFISLRLLESGLFYAEEAFDKYYDFEYLDQEEQGDVDYTPTPSQLVDPQGVDFTTAQWLSQFLGFNLSSPTAEATPWANLPGTWQQLLTDVDPTGLDATPNTLARNSDVVTATFTSNHNLIVGDIVSVTGVTPDSFNGTFEIAFVDSTTQVRWNQTGDNVSNSSVTVKGNVSLIDTNWSEIETYDPDFAAREAYIEWELSTAYHGLRRGSLKALRETAELYLTGTKTVTIVNKYLGDPWSILVKTKTSETPDGIDNTASDQVLNELKIVKPVGFKVSHLCTSTGT